MIRELNRVVLLADFPEHGLKAGDIGTVVHAYSKGGGFEVEFLTLSGETLAVVTVRADQIRETGLREVAHARTVN
jgi:hypothetical protein